MKLEKLTREDVRIWDYLNKLKEYSQCVDKQVACVIVDKSTGQILSSGVNKIISCDMNCHDKEKRICNTVHAEVMAVNNLNMRPWGATIAYVNLFPCIPCQRALFTRVSEVTAFGFKHREAAFKNIRLVPDITAELIGHDGEKKQLSIAQGELAELITCISDYFHRPEKEVPTEEIMDEIVDAELMLESLKRLIWKKDNESYNVLCKVRKDKLTSLLEKVLKT